MVLSAYTKKKLKNGTHLLQEPADSSEGGLARVCGMFDAGDGK